MGEVVSVEDGDGVFVRGESLTHHINQMEKSDYFIEDLIQFHQQRERIKAIQRLAYRSESRVHKQGVDALCLLTGPFGAFLFDTFDKHRDNDREACVQEVVELLENFEVNEKNRIIAIHLLNTHPGRIPPVSIRIEKWLTEERNACDGKGAGTGKVTASDIVAPEQIIDPSDITRWEFFDRGKQTCEFTDYRAFLNMSARLVQGAPFPLEDVFVRFHTSKGKSTDVPFPKIAEQLFK